MAESKKNQIQNAQAPMAGANQPARQQRTQIMTLKEISKYLGVHEMTVYRLLKTKKLPGFKIGGQWRTKKEVLDQWLLKDLDRGTDKK